MKRFKSLIITLILCLNCFSSIDVIASEQITLPKNNKYDILVDLTELKLYLLNADTHEVVKNYPIAGGKESTPSPLGTWIIINKESGWGKGFGTRWMQLNIPWGKYGIHGTNKPLSIGSPDSMGCIRMLNNDVEDLYRLVNTGTIVVIYGGPYGMSYNKFRTLNPGDRGRDVFEVQLKLKQLGYYNSSLDGVYGDNMKSSIIKFRKNNKLPITHSIDKGFYNSIGMNPFE
ncbi:L,D-transpeptidase family protein [Clostridium thailandense]|uniref:L,D-transpeptidase family protein n=1 Tax=Clostridium thailandense TaxID=2794346 RepID=UPI0039897E73